MYIPSIHVSSAPTRWKVLEELRQLLGSLDEQVAAQWQTHTLLQRRDAELDYRAQQHDERPTEQVRPAEDSGTDERRHDEEAEVVREKTTEAIRTDERDVVKTDRRNGNVEQQTETDRRERRRKRLERDVQSIGEQQMESETEAADAEPTVEESQQRGDHSNRKRTQHDEENQPSLHQHSETNQPTASITPLAEINIDSPAASPQLQPLLSAHGMQEIEITIDDVDSSPPQPLPPPPLPPAAKPTLPQPSSPPPPPPSRLSLLSVLTFLLPSRDPASYASWSIDTLVQRIQAEYTSQLSDLCRPTELSTDHLFSFAQLLSPVLLPTGRVRPVYVDIEVCGLIREVATHVMAAIEGVDDEADGEDEDENEDELESNQVPVDEARLALSEVVRVSQMIGMDEAEVEPIRRWLQSVALVVKPSAPAPPHSSLTNGKHHFATSLSVSPSRASTSPSSSSTSSPSPSSSSALSATPAPVSLTAAIAAAKPRYIVLDGANIGRWSGSGDPSTEVTVTTTASRPSHLQHLPSVDSRTMSRLASWQLVAAVHAIEQQLNVPALICLPEQYIRRPDRFAVQDSDLLLLLQKQGKLHRLPTGADDDSQLIRMAESGNTWIVTNDNFRDHVYTGRVTKQWVDERVIKFYTIEYPRVGGGLGAAAVRTEDEVREKGQVCLVEPSALRRNMHAKEEMEREREREEADAAAAAAAAATAAQRASPTSASGSWYDGQQLRVSKTGYPSIMSFPLHPPPQTRTGPTHYLQPSLPSGPVNFHPHSFHPPPDMYMAYPPPPMGHHVYPPVGPYWPAGQGQPNGPHTMPFAMPRSYSPPPAALQPSTAAATARPFSHAATVYPPGALRPEHFRRANH